MGRLYWNNDWKFAETWEEAMKEAVYPENEMEDVRLPHTCKELPYHYFDEHAYQMLCGYRRHFMAPPAGVARAQIHSSEFVIYLSFLYISLLNLYFFYLYFFTFLLFYLSTIRGVRNGPWQVAHILCRAYHSWRMAIC